MPLIAMDPSEAVEIVLTGYDPADADAPRIACRMLTARERIRMKRLLDQAQESEKAEEYEKTDDLLSQIFGITLTGWKNLRDRAGAEVPFTCTDGKVTALGDLLTYAEVWDLERRIWTETSLSEDVKKNAVLQSVLSRDQSAKTATADAKTKTPSSSTAPPAKEG